MWRMRQSIHSSWCLALAAACFVAGVAASLLMQVSWWVGMAAGAPLIIAFIVRAVWTLPIIAISGYFLGVGYGSAHLQARTAYDPWQGQVVRLAGRIKEDPSRTTTGGLSIQLDEIRIHEAPFPGSVYVSIRGSPDVKRGDILTLEGKLSPGFGSFPVSMRTPQVVSVIRPVPGDVGRVVRDWFADQVREAIPDPQASLGIGFLTGQKSALPEDVSEALRIAGLTHIVVASGYNLTILVRMARKLFLKVSKFLSTVSASVMILLFVSVTGMSPSMTRAGLVSSMSLFSWYYGHTFHPFVLLPLAAAITVLLQPSYVWGDLGWQLSFAAFVGVMIVAPLLQKYFFGDEPPGVVRQILGETIAAHAVTMPIIALSFGTVSHVAIIANLLVVPLVPLAMLLTFIVGLWSIVGLPFVWLMAYPTELLLSYMLKVAEFVADLSWAQSEVNYSGWVWLGYLGVLSAVCVWMWRATKLNFRSGEIQG